MSAEAWAAWATLAFLVVGGIGASLRAWYRAEAKQEKLSGDVKNIGMKIAEAQKGTVRRMDRIDARISMGRMIDIACTMELDMRIRKCELFKEDLEQ